MQGSTRRETTAAQLRGAWTRRAIGANTPWPNVRTVEAPTSGRPRPARRRRRPASRREGGDPHHPGGDSGARPRSSKSLRTSPREGTSRAGPGRRSGTSLTRERRWRIEDSGRRRWGKVSLFLLPPFFVGARGCFPLFFPFCWWCGRPTMTGQAGPGARDIGKKSVRKGRTAFGGAAIIARLGCI